MTARWPLLPMLLFAACGTDKPHETGLQDDCTPAEEIPYDGVDQDCDGTDLTDVDGDGHAAVEAGGGDCDDTDPAIHVGAREICDGRDNDCDGLVDDADGSLRDEPSWYADADGDGAGDPDDSAWACAQPSGYVADDSDCDDADPGVHPGAPEVCDEADNDCDGLVDGQDPDLADGTTWCPDADEDGFGDPGASVYRCSQPRDYTTDCTDCDDNDADVQPGATESCDGRDNDCDGLVDDDDPVPEGASPWFTDADGDGYGDPTEYVLACVQPSDTVDNGHDCDDTDPENWTCADSPDDGSVCPGSYGTDQGGVPAWTGTCNADIGLVELEGHCYWYQGGATFEDARATCAAAGGYLVTSTSSREDDLLGGLARYVILGGCEEDGGWRWITGEAWNHQRWATSQPGTDACVYQGYIPVRERWSAIPCTHPDGFVCEFGDVVVATDQEEASADCANVTVTWPEAEAVGVADGGVTVTFDAAMDDLDLHVTGEVSGRLEGTVTWAGTSATWTPTRPARGGERLTAVVTDETRCADGGRATPWSWSWHAAVSGGTASFTEVGSGLSGSYDDVALADFDGDDALEIVASTSSAVEIIDGAETGSPVVLGSVASGGYSDLVTLDADGDGHTDVAAIHPSDLTLTVWLGDGAGGLVEHDVETFTDLPGDLDVLDVDLDGAPDLVVATSDVAYYVWFRNDGTGDFGYRSEDAADLATWGELHAVAAGDVDGDGDPDLVGVGRSMVDVRWNDRADRFSQGPQDHDSDRHAQDVWLGDLDGDGLLDAAVGGGDRDVRLFLGNGEGDLDEEDAEGDGGDEILGGDLDHDGDLDLLVRGRASGLAVWENDAGDLQAGPSLLPSDWSNSMAIGDVDGDGVLDVVWARSSKLSVYLGDP